MDSAKVTEWKKEMTCDETSSIAKIIPSGIDIIWPVLTILGGMIIGMLWYLSEVEGWVLFVVELAIAGYVSLLVGALLFRGRTLVSFGKEVRKASIGKKEFVRIGDEGVRRGVEGVFGDFSSWVLIPEFQIEKDLIRVMYRGSWLVITRKNLAEHEWAHLIEVLGQYSRQQS